jgi:hypothetical protein
MDVVPYLIMEKSQGLNAGGNPKARQWAQKMKGDTVYCHAVLFFMRENAKPDLLALSLVDTSLIIDYNVADLAGTR